MSNQNELTDDHLRLVTSRTLPAGSALDAETSEQTCSRSWINQYVWPLVATGALAAGMLLAVARIAMEQRQTNEPKTVARLPDNVAPAPTALVAPTTIAWNDSLDDEITLAAATIDQLLHTSRDFDGSLLRMNDRLEALSQELQGETL
jgi:hypothetical protein